VIESWLHEFVCRQGPEMLVTVECMQFCVDRYLNHVLQWII